ncbi:transposase, partial [Nostoc sp. HG1]|nr:transposase [Nostoc sp. HG1]
MYLTQLRTAIDVGLSYFLTDGNGNQVENPRHLKKAEKSLKRLTTLFL